MNKTKRDTSSYATVLGRNIPGKGVLWRPKSRGKAADIMRILIVEDEKKYLDILQRSLRGEGYTVDGVGTAADAVDYLKTYHYDLVVMDLQLPDGTGNSLRSSCSTPRRCNARLRENRSCAGTRTRRGHRGCAPQSAHPENSSCESLSRDRKCGSTPSVIPRRSVSPC